MRSSSGLFVSIDGPSGVGKSSTTRALAQPLRAQGRPVHLTSEPSDGPIGELACELTETLRGIALACLYAADRYYHLATEILPFRQRATAEARNMTSCCDLAAPASCGGCRRAASADQY